MNKLLRYTSNICVLLSLLSCKKQHELTSTEATKSNPIELQHIVVSNELLSKALYKIQKDSSEIILKNKDSVLAFYLLRNGKAAWESIQNRNELYQAIKSADKEGLLPDDYNFKQLEKAIISTPFEKANNVALDLLFTDSYLSYAYHLANGKVNHRKLYDDWRLNKNDFQFNKNLNQSINNNRLPKSLDSYKPSHKIYQQLKNELIHSKSLINTDSLRTIVANGNKIRPNKSNSRIISVRKRLNELGYLADSLVNNSEVLDTLLQESIKQFQSTRNLQIDAIVGAGTIDALNKSYEDNYHSVLANLERWRWFPRRFGNNYIIVNTPQYQLQHITQKDTSTYTIIVGKTARKTPVFSSSIKHLDFNPKWYIPPTIKKEDIIPSATKNIDYLRRKNITVYNRHGKQLILDSINWAAGNPASYSYVQAAGNSNALGRLKIIFPNKFSVYLHDTPSKSLFKKNYRARSSGCVRVQNVFTLASNILGWSKEDVIALVDKKSTKRILTKKEIQVHFLYWSVVFNENDKPIFLNDVYKLDNELAQQLAN